MRLHRSATTWGRTSNHSPHCRLGCTGRVPSLNTWSNSSIHRSPLYPERCQKDKSRCQRLCQCLYSSLQGLHHMWIHQCRRADSDPARRAPEHTHGRTHSSPHNQLQMFPLDNRCLPPRTNSGSIPLGDSHQQCQAHRTNRTDCYSVSQVHNNPAPVSLREGPLRQKGSRRKTWRRTWFDWCSPAVGSCPLRRASP